MSGHDKTFPGPQNPSGPIGLKYLYVQQKLYMCLCIGMLIRVNMENVPLAEISGGKQALLK